MLSLVFSLVFSGCTSEEEAVIPNKDFVNALEQTNNALLENSDQEIVGEVVVEVSAGLEYESSSVNVGLNSNNTTNDVYYELELSASTVAAIISDISNSDYDAGILSILPSYTDGSSKEIIDGGNKTSEFLTFSTEALEKFYFANKSYLSVYDNKVKLGENLTDYNINTKVETVEGKNMYVTTIKIDYNQIKNIIPFVSTSDVASGQEVTIVLYQNDLNGPFESVDIILLDYKYEVGTTTINDLFNAKISIKLSFDLPIGGDNNEA